MIRSRFRQRGISRWSGATAVQLLNWGDGEQVTWGDGTEARWALGGGTFSQARTAVLDGDSLSSSQVWSVTSLNTERRSTSYWPHAAAQLGQMFTTRYAQGYGTSGHKIADILTGQSTVTTYINANNIEAVFLHIGTNDVKDTGRTVAALKTDYSTLLSTYLGCTSSPYVFVGLPLPRGDWEADLEATRATYVTRLHDIRAAINDLCDNVLATTKLVKWDAWNDFVDTGVTNSTTGLNYFPKSGYMVADGVHFSTIGSHYAGTRCANAVKSTALWAAPVSLLELVNPTGALNTNTTMTGTGGSLGTGCSGVVASNCRVERGSGTPTAVCSKETTSILGVSMTTQKIVCTAGTASGDEIYFYLEYPEQTGAGYAFDGTTGVELVAPIKVTGITGTVNGAYLYGRATVTSSYTNKDMAVVSSNALEAGQSYEWLLRTEPLLVPSGNPTRQQHIIRIQMDGTVAGTGCTVNIGPCFYRRSTP